MSYLGIIKPVKNERPEGQHFSNTRKPGVEPCSTHAAPGFLGILVDIREPFKKMGPDPERLLFPGKFLCPDTIRHFDVSGNVPGPFLISSLATVRYNLP